MPRVKKDTTPTIPGGVLLLAFLVLAALVLALFHSYTQSDLESLYLTPVRGDDRGWEISRLEEGGPIPLTAEELMECHEPVVLSRILDSDYEQAGYTTLELDGPVSVFLDGALLYTTSPGAGDSPEQVHLPETYEVMAAGESPRLTLPTGYGGRELTLVFGRGPDTYGTPMIRLSSRAVDAAGPVVTANGVMAPAAAYMTAALFLLGLLLYGGSQGRWDLSLLLLTLAAALQSLYQLREYSFRLSFPHDALNLPAAELIPALFVALPLGYLLCRTRGRHRRLWAALVLIPAGLSLLLGMGSLISASMPQGTHALRFYLLAASIAAALACAGVEAKTGNRVFRLFLVGLGTLAAALVVACLISPALAGNVTATLTLAAQGVLDTPIYWFGAALFVLCAALSVDDAIRRTADLWAKADILSTQVSALQGRVEATHATEEAIRIERHDMRHQLQVVAGMVEKGESAQALAFIGASQERLDARKPVRWCQNPVLDATFSSYLEQAKRQGIQVETSLAVPEILPVDVLELSTVFANALENAIHACADVPEGQRKLICRCLNSPQLMFEVMNTYSGQVRFDAGGLPMSNRRGHGVGTRSIAAFCEKHGAVCSYEAKDGWFRIRVVL